MRFVEAAAIASMHEHGVDLRIDSAAAQSLPEPEHKAPVFDEDPGEAAGMAPLGQRLTRRSDWNRER